MPSLRVAISTFWDGSASYECALPLWCQSAHKLAGVIPEEAPQVVVVAPHPTRECAASTRFVWSAATANASRAYVERLTSARRRWQGGAYHLESFLKDAVLLKWTIFALTDYDLALFSDLDIDVLPSDVSRKHLRADWQRAVPALMSSGALYVSSPDHAAPTNTGIWLAKPRKWVHEQALNVLANASFSGRVGFDEVGRPLDLFGHHRSTSRLLHQLDAGAAARRGVGDNEGCCAPRHMPPVWV